MKATFAVMKEGLAKERQLYAEMHEREVQPIRKMISEVHERELQRIRRKRGPSGDVEDAPASQRERHT